MPDTNVRSSRCSNFFFRSPCVSCVSNVMSVYQVYYSVSKRRSLDDGFGFMVPCYCIVLHKH